MQSSKEAVGVTAVQAAWRPSPDRHSIWQIVDHLVKSKEWARQMIEGERPPAPGWAMMKLRERDNCLQQSQPNSARGKHRPFAAGANAYRQCGLARVVLGVPVPYQPKSRVSRGSPKT